MVGRARAPAHRPEFSAQEDQTKPFLNMHRVLLMVDRAMSTNDQRNRLSESVKRHPRLTADLIGPPLPVAIEPGACVRRESIWAATINDRRIRHPRWA